MAPSMFIALLATAITALQGARLGTSDTTLKVMNYNILTAVQGDSPPPWILVVEKSEVKQSQGYFRQHALEIAGLCTFFCEPENCQLEGKNLDAQWLFLPEKNGYIVEMYANYWHKPHDPPKRDNCPVGIFKWEKYRADHWWSELAVQEDPCTGKPNLLGALEKIFSKDRSHASRLFAHLKESTRGMHWKSRGPKVLNRIKEEKPDLLIVTEYVEYARKHEYDLALQLAKENPPYFGVSYEDDVAIFWREGHDTIKPVDKSKVTERFEDGTGIKSMIKRVDATDDPREIILDHGVGRIVSLGEESYAQKIGMDTSKVKYTNQSFGILPLDLPNGRRLVVMATHFLTKNKDKDYRIKDGEIDKVVEVFQNFQRRADDVFIVAGDFNLDFHSKIAREKLEKLEQAGLENLIVPTGGSSCTSHTSSRSEWIDYMFCQGQGVRVDTTSKETNCAVVDYMPNSVEPSDHFPVFAQLTISGEDTSRASKSG